jgi:hypothetical protein
MCIVKSYCRTVACLPEMIAFVSPKEFDLALIGLSIYLSYGGCL